MNEYPLKIAGLRLLLRTPFPFRLHACLRPFLVSETARWDARCTVVPATDRPAIPADAACICKEPRMHVYRQGGRTAWCFIAWSHDPLSLANPMLLERAPNDFALYFPEAQLPRLAQEADFTNFLALESIFARFSRVLLHSSVVLSHDRAVLFCAASGVGKSTHAALWQAYLGAELLNGDRCVIAADRQSFLAYGSPCAGSSGIYRADSAPIAGIFLLSQAKENRLRRLSPAEAFPALLRESVIAQWETNLTAQLCDLLLRLTQTVPIWHLQCLPDRAAAELAHSAVFDAAP